MWRSPRSSPASPECGPSTVENGGMLKMGFRIRNFLSKLSKELKDAKSSLTWREVTPLAALN